MAARPYWSGQLKISLVSFGIQLFPATVSNPGVRFHEIDRASGKRIHHLNVVNEDKPVDDSEIVKGYEYSKGDYLIVEPKEIAKLRIETKRAIEVSQFVDMTELAPLLFEKPYFVVPQPKESPDAFAVVQEGDGGDRQGCNRRDCVWGPGASYRDCGASGQEVARAYGLYASLR